MIEYMDDRPDRILRQSIQLGFAPGIEDCAEILQRIGEKNSEDPEQLRAALEQMGIPPLDRAGIERREHYLSSRGWNAAEIDTISSIARGKNIPLSQAELLYVEIRREELPEGNWNEMSREWMRLFAVTEGTSLAVQAERLPKWLLILSERK